MERDEGVVILASAWNLDAAFCQALQLGAPVASLEALFDLHLVLGDLGFPRSFEGDDSPKEARNDPPFHPSATLAAAAASDSAEADRAGMPGDDSCGGPIGGIA